MPLLKLPLLLLLQQGVAPTTPPAGDTVGYWQQRADYSLVARLDEERHAARAEGELHYVNHSPDTLREMYVHQYLNAFRPGSRWSAADEREGRVRFQQLPDSDIAYERFTAVPTFDGTPVAPVYPYAPDSTVARFTLPRPLAPGDSLTVHFAWEARPSATVYRRQGRRGRHYDFAQWYPKVAVYDRYGWEPNPLVPAGELYGEFGTFDVTLIVADDQVLGATGVPVEGDPGWERVRAGGTVSIPRDAYGALPPPPTVTLAPGERAVRFYARDIHHFAWTASPDYRYEGGVYRDAIPVHVLYEQRGAAAWSHGAVVEYQKRALAWLESIYGPYAYPQVMAAMRLDGGATEFPMLVMYGSSISYGLALHEVGHIYSYGILANNEWRSGWMDEGLTSYQSSWAQDLTPPERALGLGPKAPPPPAGYRGHAVRPDPWQQEEIDLFALDLTGRAEPIGTAGQDFNEFSIYNSMIYDRAEMMYGALRNAIGDQAFRAFLRDYYARWKLKHVDELAMRASAERTSHQSLGWFFTEWVHHTGLVDYSLTDLHVDSTRTAWLITGVVKKRGEYEHPMPMEADIGPLVKRSPAGDGALARVAILSPARPDSVSLDPAHLSPDWDARNDGETQPTRFVFGWPFLDQWDRYRNIAAISPQLWYTGPGGVTVGARLRSNYQRLVDRWDAGLVMAVRAPTPDALPQLQGWLAVENPRLPWSARPAIGVRTGAWMVDGTFRFLLRRTWDESPFRYANAERDTLTFTFNLTAPYDRSWQDTARWENATVGDVAAEWKWRSKRPGQWFARAFFDGGMAFPRNAAALTEGFGRAEVEGGTTLPFAAKGRAALMLRAFAGISSDAPPQRSIGLSSLDPTETFENNFLRGQEAILVLPQVPYVPLGGAGMRGYSLYQRMTNVGSMNAQVAYTFVLQRPNTLVPRVRGALFGDVAYGTLAGSPFNTATWFGDAGVSAILNGALYDKVYTLRIDFPVWMEQPAMAPGNAASTEAVKFRWTFTLGDLW